MSANPFIPNLEWSLAIWWGNRIVDVGMVLYVTFMKNMRFHSNVKICSRLTQLWLGLCMCHENIVVHLVSLSSCGNTICTTLSSVLFDLNTPFFLNINTTTKKT